MKRYLAVILRSLFLLGIVLFFTHCRLGFYVIDAIDRSINDPPAGVFLFEDDQVRIETGKYKVISTGGNSDNATYRHFIRQLLYHRDGTDMDSVLVEVDPNWDDFYIHVQYKVEGHRTTPALRSVKNFLDPANLMRFEKQPNGTIVVTPPPKPPEVN